MDEVVVDSVDVDELARVREVILRAHPDVVAELVGGESVAALLDSLPAAQAAYAAVRERIAGEPAAAGAPVAPPVVPAGAGSAVIDPAGLPAHELIRLGVAEAARRQGGQAARD